MPTTRVLLTGATGYIAGQLLPDMRDRYDLRLIDVRAEDRDGRGVDGVQVADLLSDDPDALAEHFAGIDVVVHAGYQHPKADDLGSYQATYEVQRRNVDMMQRVYQLALEAGVRVSWPPAPTRRPSGTSNRSTPAP